MSDPKLISEIKEAVSIPVMAKCRIGHFAEAQILESARGRLHRRVRGADPGRRGAPHRQARLQGAVRVRLPRPRRGASPHRRGRGDDPDQGRGRHRRHRRGGAPHARGAEGHPRSWRVMRDDELFAAAKELRAPYEVVKQTAELGALPVPNFSAGGVATPADAALMRQLGAEAVFVGVGHLQERGPRALRGGDRQGATTHYDNPEILAEVSTGLGEPMRGTRSARSRRRSAWPFAAGRADGMEPAAGSARIGVLARAGRGSRARRRHHARSAPSRSRCACRATSSTSTR